MFCSLRSLPLLVVAARREHISAIAEIFLEPFSTDQKRLAILQHEHHPCPLGIAGIPPGVHGRTLNGQISGLHESFRPVIQKHEDFTLQHDTIIQALCSVHHHLVARCKIDPAAYRTAGLDDVSLSGCSVFIVLFDVELVVQVCWETRSGVSEFGEHSHARVYKWRFIVCSVNFGFALGVVRGDERDGSSEYRLLRILRDAAHFGGVFM